MFIAVNLKLLDNNPQELHLCRLEFVLAEIESGISALDTRNKHTVLKYRSVGIVPMFLEMKKKKSIKWQGDDNQYYRPNIEEYYLPNVERGMVKAIVQMHAQSKKLTKQSKGIIKALNYKV